MRWHVTTAALLLVPIAGIAAAQDTTQTQALAAPQSDSAVLAEMHATNQFEISLGRLAERNARSSQVKAYGSRLVRDHSSANEKVTALARRIGVTLPRGEGQDKNKDHQMQRDSAHGESAGRFGHKMQDTTAAMREHAELKQQLQSLRGAAFDSAFVRAAIQTHDRTIAKLESAQNQVQNAELRSLIASTLPTVRQHRETAQSLLNTVSSTSSSLR